MTALLTNSAMLDQDGQPRGMIAVAVDISDRKQLERRLQVQAFTDALTGLANRSLFMDRVQHVIARVTPPASRRTSWPCCSWTWTISRRSTTAWATAPAISC